MYNDHPCIVAYPENAAGLECIEVVGACAKIDLFISCIIRLTPPAPFCPHTRRFSTTQSTLRKSDQEAKRRGLPDQVASPALRVEVPFGPARNHFLLTKIIFRCEASSSTWPSIGITCQVDRHPFNCSSHFLSLVVNLPTSRNPHPLSPIPSELWESRQQNPNTK